MPAGTYSLYVFGASGSITDTLRLDGVTVTPSNGTLGDIKWTPSDAAYTHLWQIGQADKEGGEFALGQGKRDWYLPGGVAGGLTFTVGSSGDADWYYAQTQAGTWTVKFDLPTTYTGTAVLTVAASLTDGDSPTVAVNGHPVNGATPQGTDSTLSRQAVRSGYWRIAQLTFDAALLTSGTNTMTFTRGGTPSGNNTGMGYDTVVLQVQGSEDEINKKAPAKLAVTSAVASTDGATVRLAIANVGGRAAMDTRVEALSASFYDSSSMLRAPRVPVGPIPAGGDVSIDVSLAVPLPHGLTALSVSLSADGGRTRSEDENVPVTAA